MKTKLLIVLIFLISPSFIIAQNEGASWYFGWYVGLYFDGNTVEVLSDGALQTTEGCSSISDPSGNLLFYTDGITVYNKDHNIMENGSGLLGDPSATQSGVIVPVPNQPNLFYIFTVSNLDHGEPMTGFCYSKVNMSLQQGLGGVVANEKNIELFHNSTERVTAVKHANDYAIWVIAHEWETSKFYAYLITEDGLNGDKPIVSEIGDYMGGDPENGKGYLKASFEGTKLAVAIQNLEKVQVFDFNNTTGVISNPVSLPAGIDPYGLEFSNASKYLYAGERYGYNIFQWDLNAGDEAAIINSRKVAGTMNYSRVGALQMAIDGKIYVGRKSKKYLGVINQPSLAGAACDFVEEALYLSCDDCTSQEGLPSFIQSFFNLLWIDHERNCEKDTVFFSLNDTTNIESVLWDFGDPQSGEADTSTSYFPFHIYNEPGNYQVKVICTHVTIQEISETIEILPLPYVILIDDISICENDSLLLDAGPDFLTYKWNDNDNINSQELVVSEAGTYWVEVINYCGVDWDSVDVFVQELPEINLGNDTLITYNTEIILDAGDHVNYLWQDGSTLYELVVDYPGTYWVEVGDEIGCKSADTITIEAIPFNIYVPTAFSPNGDDVNDFFGVRTTYDVDIDFEMQVYNRWGEMVFETHSIEETWDGKYNGLLCPKEVYVWLINADTFEDNEFFSGQTLQKGTVTIVR